MSRSNIAPAIRAAIAAPARVDEGIIHGHGFGAAVAGRKAGSTFVTMCVATNQIVGAAKEAFAAIVRTLAGIYFALLS